jgi:hypothetical protein
VVGLASVHSERACAWLHAWLNAGAHRSGAHEALEPFYRSGVMKS